ncbi:MAG: enoyl-CoA hydratase-related protein [Oligoflexia bacterium]|nr:enoyl-CoA hydratase-related protein [Oligoflexia bacterium]
MFQTIEVELTARGILVVALNRPGLRNAFNEVMVEELSRAFGLRALEPDVRVVVLRGHGPVFCAGADLNWLRAAAERSYDENLDDTRKLARLFAIMNECPKPVIGAIHGAAIGGGVGLVSVCDLVVAEGETLFSLSEVRLGLIPACIGPFVIPKIGVSNARALFIGAGRIGAERARELGLVHEVVSGREQWEDAVERIVARLLECGPGALNAAKRLVQELTWPERRANHADVLEYVARLLAELRVSEEGQEGLRAFLEKRKPAWLPDG